MGIYRMCILESVFFLGAPITHASRTAVPTLALTTITHSNFMILLMVFSFCYIKELSVASRG